MTAMLETPDDNKDPHSAGDIDNDAGDSLDGADTKAPEDAPSQPATTAPGANRSANIGHS